MSVSVLPVNYDRFPELVFDTAKPSDLEEITNFIIVEFFGQLPLTTVPALDVDREIGPWIGKYLNHLIQKNMSIIVRDKRQSNRIAAASINDIDRKNRAETDFGLESFSSAEDTPSWFKICQLLHDVHRDVEFDHDPILSIDLLCVAKDYGGRGLSSLCVDLSCQVAKQNGLMLVKAEVVNAYLARGLTKAGFCVAKEIRYKYYTKNGEKPILTDSVHDSIRYMVKDKLV